MEAPAAPGRTRRLGFENPFGTCELLCAVSDGIAVGRAAVAAAEALWMSDRGAKKGNFEA